MIDLSAYKETLNGKGLAIYGLGKSGLATLQTARAAGIPVFAGDDDTEKRGLAAQRGATIFSAEDGGIWADVAALVLAPGIPLYAPAPHAVVQAAHKAGIEVFCDVELFARACPHIQTIGITGTNGKSTTTALIAHLLNAAGKPAIACGNIGAPMMAQNFTPTTSAVIELSSYQLDLCPTFRPQISVHLNITPDHLDRHGTMARYIAAKARIFEGPGFGMCGVDDAYSRDMFEAARTNTARQMIPMSCTQKLDQGVFLSGTDIIDTFFENGTVVGTVANLPSLRGLHNAQNTLMAYAATRAAGLMPPQINAGLPTYPGLPHRQLLVRRIGSVDYINDSKATNADATDKALKTYDSIYWIAGGLPKAGGLSGLESFAPKIEHAYLIGTAADDFAAWCTAQKIPYTITGTLDRALLAAHTHAQASQKPGVVLLSPACASFDQFKSYEHRGDVFTELVHRLSLQDAA